MNQLEFKKLTEEKIVILDGATGSNLQKRGMPSGVSPEQWILEHQEVFIGLQEEYLEAGSDILYAPTFTANRIKLKEYDMESRIEEVNASLVELSKEAVRRFYQKHGEHARKIYIAGDLTMTGEQLYPLGTLMFDELVDIYKEQIQCLLASGVDLFVVETMISLQECRAALIAAKECCDLPVMVTLTFEKDNRTLYGTDPKTALIVLQELGAAAVGINCSTGPDKMADVIKVMKPYARVPLIAKPNAGLPILKHNKTVYSMDSEAFSKNFQLLIEAGVNIIGGCCGTEKEHISCLVRDYSKVKPAKPEGKSIRAVTTERDTVEIDLNGRLMIVGERINPTGKKALQAELKNGDLDLVVSMAKEQEENGADILDINMGMNGIDEKDMMLKVVYEVLSHTGLPLCIDSSHVDVMEAALRIYPGRALINSISLETEKFEKLIPIAKKYGAMFIMLPLSDQGLPKNLEEKKEIIQTILSAALKAGLKKEDIIIDALVNTIGASKDAALTALETIHYCKNELGIATIMGLSNISYGLPERGFINSAFLTLAIKEGLTTAIANPSQDLLMNTAFAADLLINKPDSDIRYIDRVSKHSPSDKNTVQNQSEEKQPDSALIYEAVLKGSRKKVLIPVKKELERGTPAADILHKMLIPAIDEVGELFESKRYFLPQLIASAETMNTAIEVLEPLLLESNKNNSIGTIVIATVHGDIHDIGKNLVALMLKNNGFKIIDLGKDVESEKIIESAKESDADIIALSALMTTTMTKMKEVVMLRNQAGLSAKIMIGGAVVTQSFCDEIGADGFSSDAGEAVVIAKQLVLSK